MISAGGGFTDPMIEQTVTGDTLRREQNEGMRDVINTICEKHRATWDHYAEVSGIDPQRMVKFMRGEGQLNDDEWLSSYRWAEKTEKAATK